MIPNCDKCKYWDLYDYSSACISCNDNNNLFTKRNIIDNILIYTRIRRIIHIGKRKIAQLRKKEQK